MKENVNNKKTVFAFVFIQNWIATGLSTARTGKARMQLNRLRLCAGFADISIRRECVPYSRCRKDWRSLGAKYINCVLVLVLKMAIKWKVKFFSGKIVLNKGTTPVSVFFRERKRAIVCEQRILPNELNIRFWAKQWTFEPSFEHSNTIALNVIYKIHCLRYYRWPVIFLHTSHRFYYLSTSFRAFCLREHSNASYFCE